MPDDGSVGSESVGAGDGNDMLVRVTRVVLDKRLVGVDVTLEPKKCRMRGNVMEGTASEAVDPSPWSDNIRINVHSQHWVKWSAI